MSMMDILTPAHWNCCLLNLLSNVIKSIYKEHIFF